MFELTSFSRKYLFLKNNILFIIVFLSFFDTFLLTNFL